MHSEAQHDPVPTPAHAAAPLAVLVLGALVATALLVLLGYASLNAASCAGRPFAGLFVDPFGSFSAISWPTWRSASLPLRFPDRLVAIDGARLPLPGVAAELPAHQLARRTAALHDAGAAQVALTFRTGAGEVVVTRHLLTLGRQEQIFFFALYAVVGLFVVWSGVAALVLARRRAGAVAYAWWTAGTFCFLVTFFDYHTTARLVPVFSVSTVWVQICLVWLAYSFPDPPRRHRRALRRAVVTFTALEATAALALLAGPSLSHDLTWLRVAVGYTALGSLVVLLVGIMLKLRTERERRRQELLSASWGLVAVPASLAVGFGLLSLTGTGVVHLLLPFLAPLLPLSIGYALIRHNILATTAVLTRRMFVVPVLTGATAVALMVWLALSSLLRGRSINEAFPAVVAAAALLGLSVFAYRLSGRFFFRATAKFRPTIQQLADQLASRRDMAEIHGAIEAAVMRWLPTGSASILQPDQLPQVPSRPADALQRLMAGESVWTTEIAWRRQLMVPMRSRGELRGLLLLAPKHQEALYTGEDLQLLETIASLAAVAMHNAEVIAEVEALRHIQVDAARDEKRLALGMLGAEITHEIAYPLNFLRYLLAQGQGGRVLDTTDLAIGREEIGRLERMFATLRKLKYPLPNLEPVAVLPRATRALDLIREVIVERRLDVRIDVPDSLTVDAEPDALVQIFANLLRNAAQAVADGQAIGLRAHARDSGGTLVLEVWDEGPGVPEALASSIFSPFVTSKAGSMGIGLAVTHRLVRRFGWTIGVGRAEGQTTFRIEIPPPGARRRYQEE